MRRDEELAQGSRIGAKRKNWRREGTSGAMRTNWRREGPLAPGMRSGGRSKRRRGEELAPGGARVARRNKWRREEELARG